MLRIITHIERLLLTHDCVILPKFGGFVLQILPATYEEEEHSFRPMRKEVMFNVTLQHTDGLLSESYMQTYGVDYRKAQLMLEEDIEALNVSLEQDKRITLGRIGTFSIGEEGQTIFTPGDSGVFNADSYGLSSFHFPVLRSLEEEREEVALLTGKKNKDVFYIPVSRKLIRVVAASAAAVALFFVVSTPVKEVNLSAYTASFVPTEMINYRFEEPISQLEEIQVSQEDEMVAEVTPKIEATIVRTASHRSGATTVSIPREGVQSSRMKSYSCFAPSSTCLSIFSRFMQLTRETSSPASSILAGIRSTPSAWCRIPSPGGILWSFMAFAIRVERVVGSSSGCCQPMLMVKLPCGSASTNRTFLPSIASPMPRFSQVVVLPVPPFWLTMAIVVAFFEIFITPDSLSRG